MSINRTAHTFGGEAATSTRMNAEVKALWDGLQDSWDAYTPAWASTSTQPTLGNGVLTGRYMQVGKTVHWYIQLKFGTTTTRGSGFYRFELPDFFDRDEGDTIGTASVVDNSTGDKYTYGATYREVSGVPCVEIWDNLAGRIGATFPISLTDFDHVTLQGTGEFA